MGHLLHGGPVSGHRTNDRQVPLALADQNGWVFGGALDALQKSSRQALTGRHPQPAGPQAFCCRQNDVPARRRKTSSDAAQNKNRPARTKIFYFSPSAPWAPT
jgi:hypothetical protein